MAKEEWFRNTYWDTAIEEAFFKKLARARDKQRYLRIQASTLAFSFPAITLRLLDRYFSMGDDLFMSSALVDRANAFVALGDMGGAVEAFEAALARENSYGKSFTNAYLDYPFLIVSKQMVSLYDRALELVDRPPSGLVFPANSYKRNCVRAIILAERGSLTEARDAARLALEAAAQTHSGLRYHPTVGLVADENGSVRDRLNNLVNSSSRPITGRMKAWFGGS